MIKLLVFHSRSDQKKSKTKKKKLLIGLASLLAYIRTHILKFTIYIRAQVVDCILFLVI